MGHAPPVCSEYPTANHQRLCKNGLVMEGRKVSPHIAPATL